MGLKFTLWLHNFRAGFKIPEPFARAGKLLLNGLSEIINISNYPISFMLVMGKNCDLRGESISGYL